MKQEFHLILDIDPLDDAEAGQIVDRGIDRRAQGVRFTGKVDVRAIFADPAQRVRTHSGNPVEQLVAVMLFAR